MAFYLADLKFFKIPLNHRHKKEPRKNFHKLLENRNFIGLEKDELEESLKSAGFSREENIKLPSPENPPFVRIDYELHFKCPVISNDPIAALLHENSPDAVMFQKTKIVYIDGKPEPTAVYSLKGEGIRGPLRYLVGKTHECHDIVHDDCDCPMCRIFGNNQTGGHVRFEDAELLPKDQKECENGVKRSETQFSQPIRCDHVAIDWNAGGKEHAKFDDYPLPGSPGEPLKFKGIFWVSNLAWESLWAGKCQNSRKGCSHQETV